MNDLSVRPAGGAAAIPDAATSPRLSGSLMAEVERATDPNDQSGGRYVTTADRDEAARVIAEFKRLLAPVGRRHFTMWLGAINAACRNPQSEAEFTTRLASLGTDCGDLPAACFTVETRRDLYALTSFFPGAGDIRAVCEPMARRWRRQLAALRRIAAGAGASPRQGPDPAMVPPDPAHVARQVASLRQHIGEQEARIAGAPAVKVTARTVPVPQLIAAYEQEIRDGKDTSGALAFRLAGLRRQFGAPA